MARKRKILMDIGLGGLVAVAATLASAGLAGAQPVLITTPTTIGPNDTMIGVPAVPLATAEITVRGTTLTINGRHTVRSLAVETNTTNNQPGIVTHSAGFTHDYSDSQGTDVVHGLHLTIEQNAVVRGPNGVFVGSRISADSCGHAGSEGPGQGGAASGRSGGGGGYGGAGCDAGGSSQSSLTPGIGGACYGYEQSAVFAPALLGSGGGNTFSGANPNVSSGGRGGGCIRLVVGGALTIGGEISARGGNGAAYAGGGSGGSIFLSSTLLSGNGTINASGGTGGSGCCSGTGGGGGGGRIAVLFDESDFGGTAVAHGNVGNGRAGAGTVYVKASGWARGTLTIDNGGSFGETTEVVGPLSINADVVVQNGGRFGPSHGQTDFDVTVLGDLSVGPTGAVYADARGSAGSVGAGRGGSADGASGGGGGYGGAGSDAGGSSQATLRAGLGGSCYGTSQTNVFGPLMLGSGGGNTYSGGSPNPDTGGYGGGVIRLNVAGTLTVAGEVSSRGGSGAAYAGGGSGGSISLTCGALAGAGTITARGGDGGGGCCSGTGGGGGGGRIAVIFGSSSFTGAVSAFGGAGQSRAGAGTVYTRASASSRGNLVVDNGGNPGETTELPSGADYDANITVTRAGRIGPSHGQTNFSLRVRGNLTIEADGAVYGDGRGFVGSMGPGRGTSADGASGGGGGYGGAGGRGSVSAPGGSAYGSTAAFLLGSGGGNTYSGGSPNADTGGLGGGAIRLSVDGTLNLLGEVSARGATGAAYAGAGSGGTVHVLAGTLVGGGRVVAGGGNGAGGCCATTGGGGGGGRVVVLSCNASSPMISVSGGTGAQPGQPGTVYAGRVLHPVDSGTNACGTAAYTVLAPGANTTYQWQRETTPGSGEFVNLANGTTGGWDGGGAAFGAIVTGAATASMSIAADTASGKRLGVVHAIRYRCVTTSSCGTVFSDPARLTICVADSNCDGSVTLQDIFEFLSVWFASDARADINGAGGVTLQDLFDFITAYFAGCPA